jgi:transposase
MPKEYINEAVWSKIFSFLKENKGVYLIECKNFFEAIYWMSRTGAQWRELPDRYGNWNSIFKRFNAWSKKKIFDDLMAFCAQDPDLEYISIDATIVRAHACAAGYGKQESEGLGRSKGGFTSKVHIKVDALGNPLKFIVTPGQTSDITQANALLEGITGVYILGDKGYDSKALRETIKQQKGEPVIPSKSNALCPQKYDKDIYKERHVVECYFSKMKQFRRVFSRFDKSIRNFNSFLCFVGAAIWLR